MKTTNIVIIGAGIVGCFISHFLKLKNIEHILLDENKYLFDNASGCAGAFIAPKLGKNSDLQDMYERAYSFAIETYSSLEPNIFNKEIVLFNKSKEYKTKQKYSKIDYLNKEAMLFKDALVANPKLLGEYLLANNDVLFDYKVKSLQKNDNYWVINNNIQAKKVILSTGYKNDLFKKEKYIPLRFVAGSKIDIKSCTNIKKSFYDELFVSNSKNGYISIGATHHRDITDINKEKEISTLLLKAQDKIELKNIKIEKYSFGKRANSNDYFPILSKIIDQEETLKKYPHIKHGTKVPYSKMIFKENLFICSGVGGRGYTLAPYLANMLVNYLIDDAPMYDGFSLHKRFLKYCARALV